MIDLHLHSTFSDGMCTPEELVALAVERGIRLIALTDHDTMAGVERFLAAAADTGVSALPGVEISLESEGGTLHLLGYGADPACPTLTGSLGRIRNGRAERNAVILQRLQAMGIAIEMEQVQSLAEESLVGRPHFARVLVQLGVVADIRSAFDRFLAQGRPAYVERIRLTPERGIARIQDAGGLAVLAHPLSLGLSTAALRRRIRDLAELGLDGMEVYYADYARETIRRLAGMAADFGLLKTGGTDYHGDAERCVLPGVGARQGCDDQALAVSFHAALDRRRVLCNRTAT